MKQEQKQFINVEKDIEQRCIMLALTRWAVRLIKLATKQNLYATVTVTAITTAAPTPLPHYHYQYDYYYLYMIFQGWS